MIAIGGHGTGVPATGETLTEGHTYGSISNLILSLKAVVFDPTTHTYQEKTFDRSDQECQALLVSLGRTFITEVTLQVGPNKNLRCQSYVDIPTAEVFAPNALEGRTFSSFMDSAGRVEAILFPFSDKPWLKVWSVTPDKPSREEAPDLRETNTPYNYTFSDNISKPVAKFIGRRMSGSNFTPFYGKMQKQIVSSSLSHNKATDLWGKSKNLLLYIKPTTLRETANGYAIITSRKDAQRAMHEFVIYYQERLDHYAKLGQYPVNGQIEIRVTGLDNPKDVLHPSALSPQLSVARPRPDHSEWDVAIWIDILTIPGTPHSNEFYREVEHWLLSNFAEGSYAEMRSEWSKAWGYSNQAPWDDAKMLSTTAPEALRIGQPENDNWDTACATLDRYDPYRIFTTNMLDKLMPQVSQPLQVDAA